MAYRTILLKSGREGEPLPKEDKAIAAITPGHLIERNASGVQKHSTGGGSASPRFAIEDSLQGQEISDAYTTGARVQSVMADRGDEVYAWLAQGESVVPGDKLESNGDGTLRKYVAQSASSAESETFVPDSIVAESMETLDLSTSADSATRFAVEIV